MLYFLWILTNSATREMMTIAKANNASYVTISESPVRMKEIHRHHSFQVNLKGAKKKLFLSSNEKGATATVVVFLRVSPSREIPFFILRRVSGLVKEKREGFGGVRATDGRPYGAEFFGEQFFCVENKRKGVCPCACNARGVVIY